MVMQTRSLRRKRLSGDELMVLDLAERPLSIPRRFDSYGYYDRSSLNPERGWYDLGCFVDHLEKSRSEVARLLNAMQRRGLIERKKGRFIPGEQAIVSMKTMVDVGKGHRSLWFYSAV